MTRRLCAVRWPARGASSVCRILWRLVSNAKRRRASVLRRWRARRAPNTSSTHPWDRRERTGIPHFDNKWRIEETVRGLRFPSQVILRPVFFTQREHVPNRLSLSVNESR